MTTSQANVSTATKYQAGDITGFWAGANEVFEAKIMGFSR
jgi:hypothetical protein